MANFDAALYEAAKVDGANKFRQIVDLTLPMLLPTGFVDPDAEYPKAVQALKDAGIDQYVAEVQRQLDAYMK